MRARQKLYNENNVQVLLFPLPSIYISQGENGQYSHRGTLNIDFLGYNNGGRVYNQPYYAPCDVKCVYKSSTAYYNIWESINPVYCADGVTRKICFQNIHGNMLFSVGTVKRQGEQIGVTGSYGQATGDHLHFNVAEGTYKGQQQVPDWTLKNSIHIYNACFTNDTNIIHNPSGYNFREYQGQTLTWVARDDYLTQSERENNAQIITNYYRSIGINDCTIAAILGNMEAESTLSPILNERGGGGGYGLVQWTPKSVLENHCSTLGLSPYSSGDVQIEVIIDEILGTPNSVREWYSSQGFVENYYNSGATADMIGITGQQFLDNSMNWTPSKLAVLFMTCYERPSYDPSVNHYNLRMQYANKWYEFIQGISPTPIEEKKHHFNFILFNRRRRIYGQANVFR